MEKYKNRLVVNVRSPKNEAEMTRAYAELNPKAKKPDGLDIAAVKTTNGERGYALVNPSINRSKDKGVHIGKDFIPKSEVEKQAKKK